MRIHFLGGVDTVTGSRHMVEVNGRLVLRDCGLFQGHRREAFEINRHAPCAGEALESIILSHAHIDHCGNLPSLARHGIRRPIHATTATAELCRVMLRDSAHIQEQDAAYLNQKTNRRNQPPVEPLYTTADVEATLPLFRGCQYGDTIAAAPGVEVVFAEAGHILGAALTTFICSENQRRVRIGFAVDLGRKNLPLIRDPDVLQDIDTLILESTYGDRLHDDARVAEEELGRAVRATLERGGKVIIPSFALERAQELIYHLASLFSKNQLPRVPVYVDSPMAMAVTRIFELNYDYLDAETRALNNIVGSVVTPPWVHFVASVEESKAVSSSDKPAIVISASGMCESGRILHHLKHGIENPRNTIIIVGFQAQHTLGRRLVERVPKVKIFGDWFALRAQVVSLNAFSAHADRNELLEYVRAVDPRRIFLVHGEADQRAALAEALRAAGWKEVFLPTGGDVVTL